MSASVEGLQGQQAAGLRGRPVNRLALILRAVFAVSLIVFLFYYFDFSKIIANLTSVKPGFAFVALGILAAQYLLSCVRWHYILSRHSLHFSFHRAFAIYGIGALANLVLLNAIAGMSVRGVLLVRDGTSTSRAVGALLIERVAAIGGMALCMAVGLVFSYKLLLAYLGGISPDGAKFWIIAAAVPITAVAAALLWRFEPIRRFAAQVRESLLSFYVLAFLVVSSAAIIVLGFLGVAALARGMNIDIDPLFFVAVMPTVALVAALPISIGGWGVREGMMVAGLALFNVPAEPAAALSILYGIAGVAVACVLGAFAVVLYTVEQRGQARSVHS